MSETPDILFIDDEQHLRNAVSQTFELADLKVQCFDAPQDALERVTRDYTGIVVTDIRMPEMDGSQVLRQVLEIDYELPVVLVTGHGDVQMAVEAMRAGAYDFIEKPFSSDHLVEVVRKAIDKRRLTLENRELRANVTRRDDLEARLLGRTREMVELRKIIRSVALTDTDLIVVGDTGTGKEVVARSIHDLSERRDKQFVALNCSSIPASQIESELFGHEQGAFPGAMRARFGKLEHARGGTVFLDDFENMPQDMQTKLLRVLEERTITRMGSNEPIELDVRFIAASKSNLEEAVQEGRLRDDLFYRLEAVTLRVPCLDERKEDIPRLFTQLANEAARRYRRDFVEIPSSLLSTLGDREWPGNVRQLRNAADRYVLGLEAGEGAFTNDFEKPRALSQRMAEHEKKLIAAELQAQKGVLRNTYLALGLSRKSLYEKMQKYGLDRDSFKEDDA
jgi:two-component system C4-dicarboxylate transport response regulator DctD